MKSLSYVVSMYLILALLSIILSTISWSVISNLRHGEFLDAVEQYSVAAEEAARDPSQQGDVERAAGTLRSFAQTPEQFESFMYDFWFSAMIHSFVVLLSVGFLAGVMRRPGFIPVLIVAEIVLALYYVFAGPLYPVYQRLPNSNILFATIFIWQATVGGLGVWLGLRYRQSIQTETAPRVITPRSASAVEKKKAPSDPESSEDAAEAGAGEHSESTQSAPEEPSK